LILGALRPPYSLGWALNWGALCWRWCPSASALTSEPLRSTMLELSLDLFWRQAHWRSDVAHRPVPTAFRSCSLHALDLCHRRADDRHDLPLIPFFHQTWLALATLPLPIVPG
jgi:hypothetical protein